MKKIIYIALLFVAVINSAVASGNKIDTRAINSFNSAYYEATDVGWRFEQSFVKVNFELKGKKLLAYYQPSGELIATSEKISLEDLPVDAKRRFAKKYSGYTVKEAVKFETTDEMAYFILAVNENGSEIVKVSDCGFVSLYRKM
ncbi:MAG: hypothetical protein JWQ40_4899 [Segetibacter sp.]|nr:hypothetical protein [Segetibacter sp.]